MEIKTVMKEIHDNAKAKGFWDKEKNFGEELMLVVSELGEALEAHRKKHKANYNDFYENQAPYFVPSFEKFIKDTVEDELSDAVIRLFDLCQGLGIDLEWHIEQKMKYNATRSKLHGKTY